MSMHHLRGARALLAGAATAALLLGGALGASADPTNPDTGVPEFRAVNGTGSDTTQDLNNGLAAVLTELGSYDATIPATDSDVWIQTRECGTWIPRPNGSGPGVAALKAAKAGQVLTNARGTSRTDNAPCGGAPGTEDVQGPLTAADLQFARSSSGIPASTSGNYSYVPLAVDAVTYAVHTNNTTVPRNLTSADLTAIYSADNGEDVVLSTGTYTIGQAGTGADIVPFIPQAGSGTRSFWLSAVLDGQAQGTAVSDTYSGGIVQEHNGAVLAAVPNAITPFSIAQHIAQGNSALLEEQYRVTVNDRRSGAVLAEVDDADPLADGALNTEFPFARPVFTVVQHAEIATNANLRNAFVDNPSTTATEGAVYTAGTGSSFAIEDFGFGSLVDRDTTVNGVEIDGELYQAGDAENFRTN